MLTSDEFWIVMWSIIEEANGDEGKLRRILASKPEGVIVLFEKEFRRAMGNISNITVPGSEDMKKDIFAHVVSKGAEFYDYIVTHPGRIPTNVRPTDPCFFGLAGEVFMDKFGKELSLE